MHQPLADRQVVPALDRHRVVLEGAGKQMRPACLDVERELIAVTRVQHVVRGVALQIETERAERARSARRVPD